MGSTHPKDNMHGEMKEQGRSEMSVQTNQCAKNLSNDRSEVLKILVQRICNDLIIEKEKNTKLEKELKKVKDEMKQLQQDALLLKDATTTAKEVEVADQFQKHLAAFNLLHQQRLERLRRGELYNDSNSDDCVLRSNVNTSSDLSSRYGAELSSSNNDNDDDTEDDEDEETYVHL